jgi:hypothetical protein
MGALEKIYSIIMLSMAIGVLVCALVASGAAWFSDCFGTVCVASTLSQFQCIGFDDVACPFFWVDPPVGSFAGIAIGGAISLIALIIIMLIEVIAAVGHAMRLFGKTLPLAFLKSIANWNFVAVGPLALLAVLSFPIAFGVDEGIEAGSLKQTATTGVGVTVLIIIISVVNMLVRFIPIAKTKLRYDNAMLS